MRLVEPFSQSLRILKLSVIETLEGQCASSTTIAVAGEVVATKEEVIRVAEVVATKEEDAKAVGRIMTIAAKAATVVAVAVAVATVKAAGMEDTEEAETVDTVEAEMVDTVEVEEAAMEAAIETTEIMAVMMAGRPPSFEQLFCVTGVDVTERNY